MTAFIIIAAFMTLLAVGVIVWPLARRGNRRVQTALITALLIPGAAAALYSVWSTWNWHAEIAQTEAPPDVGAMVSRLEQRLKTDPTNLQGWLMLGRSYMAMERFDDAATAYDKAVHLSDEHSAEAFLGYGEALSLRSGGDVTPQAADVFEHALKLEPQNPKALLFGGFAAATRGERDLARSRWTSLRAMNPPPQIMQMLDAHLAELSGAAPPMAAPGGTAAPGEGVAPPPAVGGPAGGGSANAVAGAQAQVTVKLAAAFKARVNGDTALFVFAREPGVPGPPLAVKRLSAGALDSIVTLSAADSMMAGRSIQAGHKVAITARISFTGQPLPSAGDLYGELTYDVGTDGVRELMIDRVSN
jgi:cytochrome c-type biogenesis protein CcmH